MLIHWPWRGDCSTAFNGPPKWPGTMSLRLAISCAAARTRAADAASVASSLGLGGLGIAESCCGMAPGSARDVRRARVLCQACSVRSNWTRRCCAGALIAISSWLCGQLKSRIGALAVRAGLAHEVVAHGLGAALDLRGAQLIERRGNGFVVGEGEAAAAVRAHGRTTGRGQRRCSPGSQLRYLPREPSH